MSPKSIFKFFASLRLTVVLLALGIVLVFTGTLAQVEVGLFKAQTEFFHSFLIFWTPKGWPAGIPYLPGIPVFPGGYLIGVMLLFNLVAAHFARFKFTRNKIGIAMIHGGIVLLLLGQLFTDKLSTESVMHLRIGETKNYTEAQRQCELAVIDTTDPKSDLEVTIPQRLLMKQGEIANPHLPFSVVVKKYYANSDLQNRSPADTSPVLATQGLGLQLTVKPLPRVTATDQRDLPTAIVEIVTPQGSLGTWLVSESLAQPQTFVWNNHTYQLALRLRRYYKPFSIQLLNFTHDRYPGTDIPKNFSSQILLQRPGTGEKRQVRIYMNNPLRYDGETFYQASFDTDDKGSIFQVVRNPSWLTPYFSCVLVGLGLMVQFLSHLIPFIRRRMTT